MKKILRVLFLIVWFLPAMPFLGLSYLFYGLSWLTGTVPALWFYVKGEKNSFKKNES